MNHAFVAAPSGIDKCVRCKFPYIAHTAEATCETCTVPGPVEIRHGNTLMCEKCWTDDLNVRQISNSQPNSPYTPEQQARHAAFIKARAIESENALNKVLAEAKEKDLKVQLRTDMFNANTEAIKELKTAIDNDENIKNKPFELGKILKERFDHFQAVVFAENDIIKAAEKKIEEAVNTQKAIQIYMNTLANQLREEERAILRIENISYKPEPPKPGRAKKIETKPSTKTTQADLKKYAKEIGAPTYILQQVIVSKGMDVKTAAEYLKKSMNKGELKAASEESGIPVEMIQSMMSMKNITVTQAVARIKKSMLAAESVE